MIRLELKSFCHVCTSPPRFSERSKNCGPFRKHCRYVRLKLDRAVEKPLCLREASLTKQNTTVIKMGFSPIRITFHCALVKSLRLGKLTVEFKAISHLQHGTRRVGPEVQSRLKQDPCLIPSSLLVSLPGAQQNVRPYLLEVSRPDLAM